MSPSAFYALMYRMRFTPRWSGSFSVHQEDVAQHTLGVAQIAHLLCEMVRATEGRTLDVGQVVTYALYHDAADTVLTHVISPVKRNPLIKEQFKELKKATHHHLLELLPSNMRDAFQPYVFQEADESILEIVEIADLIESYLKCRMELRQGNRDFEIICQEIAENLASAAEERPYVHLFIETFCQAFEDEKVWYRYLKEANHELHT